MASLARPPGAALDLFGEIPVSLDELLAWMLAVPGIPPTSPRFGMYVRTYDVIGKIRAAKRDGMFEAMIAEPPLVPARLAPALNAASFAPRGPVPWRSPGRR